MKKLIASSIAAALMTISAGANARLLVDTYDLSGSNNVNLGQLNTAIGNATPIFSGAAEVIDFSDGAIGGNFAGASAFPGGLVNNFGLHIYGALLVEEAGIYSFRTSNDDFVQLTVNGQRIISENRVGTFTSKPMELAAGLNEIDLRFIEKTGGAYLELSGSRFGFNDGQFALLGTAGFETVPEPGSVALLGLGMLGIAAAARKKKAA